jgi:hypothetical protein
MILHASTPTCLNRAGGGMIHACQYTNLTEQGRRGHSLLHVSTPTCLNRAGGGMIHACQYTNLSEQGRGE